MKSVRLDISNDNIYFDTQTLKYMRSTESVVSVEETGDSILRYEFAKSSQLKKLVILVTNCCNMSCRYCIADEGLYTQNKCRAFFDKELIIGKIRELLRYILMEYNIFSFSAESLCLRILIYRILLTA